MPSVKIAAISLAVIDGLVESNYARAIRLAEIAIDEHRPDIVLLPEAFAAGYCGKDLTQFVETPSNSSHQRKFAELSAHGNCMIIGGFVEPGDAVKVRNTVAIYDRGRLVGLHRKRDLWPDAERPYRDEVSAMIPGDDDGVFRTRAGTFAVVICYENMLDRAWRVASDARVDFVLSPYNCQGDPSVFNVKHSTTHKIPSAWADRTGMTYTSEGYKPNLGTAGLTDESGKVIAISTGGAEQIVVGELNW